MRNVLFAFAAVLALGTLSMGVVGCGDDSTVSVQDLGKDGPTTLDLSMNTATSTCGDLIDCGNACTTQACLTACVKKGTASAQAAYKALGDCIDTACPSAMAADGGTPMPCDFNAAGMLIDKTACDKCVSDTQATGGACKSKLDACAADGA
jgi:hypothetical protein